MTGGGNGFSGYCCCRVVAQGTLAKPSRSGVININRPTSTAVPGTACCKTVFVDLGTAPEGVWSNASAVLIPEDGAWSAGVINAGDKVGTSRTSSNLARGRQKTFCCSVTLGRVHGTTRWKQATVAVLKSSGMTRQENLGFPDPKTIAGGTIVLYENDDSV